MAQAVDAGASNELEAETVESTADTGQVDHLADLDGMHGGRPACRGDPARRPGRVPPRSSSWRADPANLK
ncbi:MAG TPA: hypothetical protein VGO86_07785 [Candidatus Dormibacteraeota bacterium]|jgi:hypothetical protein